MARTFFLRHKHINHNLEILYEFHLPILSVYTAMNKNITMGQLTPGINHYYRIIMWTISYYLRILKHICHLTTVWFRLSPYHNLRIQNKYIVKCIKHIATFTMYNLWLTKETVPHTCPVRKKMSVSRQYKQLEKMI